MIFSEKPVSTFPDHALASALAATKGGCHACLCALDWRRLACCLAFGPIGGRPSSVKPATASLPSNARQACGASIPPGNARSPTGRAPASRSRGRSAPRSFSRCAAATARPTAMTASGREPRSASGRTAPAPERAYVWRSRKRASRSWRTPSPISVAPSPSPDRRRPSWSRSSPGRTPSR
jgi:hypothetical protein